MSIKIALAGNPNWGETTLFGFTGCDQFVVTWFTGSYSRKEGR